MSDLTDHGPHPYVLDIEEATIGNGNFRSTLWSGNLLQLTVMSIPVGGDVGLEQHVDNDQFLRLEQGTARVEMGPTKDDVTFRAEVSADWAILVPAGTWHNIINTGDTPMKLYALYGPAHHPHGTVHATQAAAEEAEREH